MRRVAYIAACALVGTVAMAAGWVRDGWRENVRPSGWRVSGYLDGDGFTRWVSDGCRVVRSAPGVSGPVLVAWYELEDAAANQIVVDSSGLGHPAATFSGLTAELTVGGVVGSSLLFSYGNRFESYDGAVASALSSASWTIAFWMRRDASTGHAEIFGFANGAGEMLSWVYHNNDTSEVLGVFPGLSGMFTLASPFTALTWVHVAFVRDVDAFRLYANGLLAVSGVFTEIVPVAGFWVGGLGTEYPDGRRIDDIRVYQGALSGAEIGELFAGYPPAPPPPPPVYFCTFDCNGGFLTEGESYSKEVTPGQAYGTLPWPGKEGYTFGGWYSYDLNDYVYDWSTVALGFDHTVVAVWY